MSSGKERERDGGIGRGRKGGGEAKKWGNGSERRRGAGSGGWRRGSTTKPRGMSSNRKRMLVRL